MDYIGGREDQTTENILLIRLCLPHGIHRGLQAKDIAQGCLHGITHVVVRHRKRIGIFLHLDQKPNIFNGNQVLGKGHKEQVGNMLRVILFLHRIGNNILFDVVADH